MTSQISSSKRQVIEHSEMLILTMYNLWDKISIEKTD
jgi:hypothetical protein